MNAIVSVKVVDAAKASKADAKREAAKVGKAIKAAAAKSEAAAAGAAGLVAVGEAAREYGAASSRVAGLGARLVKALSAPGVLSHVFHYSHTVKGVKGSVAAKQSLREFAASLVTGEAAKGAKASAFKAAVLQSLGFNDLKSAPAESAWRYMIQDALPAAVAIADAGCTASVDGDGNLKVGGGATRGAKAEQAKAAREAGSVRKLKALGLSALGKAGDTGRGKGKSAGAANLAKGAALLAAIELVLKEVRPMSTKGDKLAGAAADKLAALVKLAPSILPA